MHGTTKVSNEKKYTQIIIMHYTQKGKQTFLKTISEKHLFFLTSHEKQATEIMVCSGELPPPPPPHTTAATHLYQLPSPWKMAMHRPGPLATSRFSRGSFSRSEIFLSCCMECWKQHRATLPVILCRLAYRFPLFFSSSWNQNLNTRANQPPTFPQFHFRKAKCQLTHHRTRVTMHDNKLAHAL